MVNYFLDLETSGLNPKTSQILTIQFQELDRTTSEPIGELIILKSWESSEREILTEFAKGFCKSNPFDFVACGYNLKFEHDFLKVRGELYGLKFDLLSKPTIDIHPIGIMMNNGEFKGSGLDKMSGKVGDGFLVLEMYASKDYDGIIEYIKQEAREYLRLFVWLKTELPKLHKEYLIELGQI